MSTEALIARLKSKANTSPARHIVLGRHIQAWLQHPDGEHGAPESVQKRGRWALDRMVEENYLLAVAVASKNKELLRQCHSIDFDDLLQECAIGLLLACRKYDPTRATRLSTLAYWYCGQMAAWKLISGHRTRLSGTKNAIAKMLQVVNDKKKLDDFTPFHRQSIELVTQALQMRNLDGPASNDLTSALHELIPAQEPDRADDDVVDLVERLRQQCPQAVELVEMRLVDKRSPAEVGSAFEMSNHSVHFAVDRARAELREAIAA